MKLPTDLHSRANDCADRVDMAFCKWCGIACRQHHGVVAKDTMRGIATTCVTIDGEYEAGFARAAILAAVERAEERDTMNPAWFTMGVESVRCGTVEEVQG